MDRNFGWGAAAGAFGLSVVAILIWGAAFLLALLGKAVSLGISVGSWLIPTFVASIALIVLFSGLAILLAAMAVGIVGNLIDKLLERAGLSSNGAAGKAIRAAVETVRKPERWYLWLSAAFVALLETTKELNDEQSSIKVLIYVLLVAVIAFTYFFRQRKNPRFLIAAFAAPALLCLMYGWVLIDFDASRHPVWSHTAVELALRIKEIASTPGKAALLVLPALIAISSFIAVMREKSEGA